MSEQASSRSVWSGIDIPKTIAGVLAAVSAAVVGSFLGVAGTLGGAAVASIVGSVGTEIYHRWIARSSQKIRQTFVTAPAAVGTPEVAAAAEEIPSQPEPGTGPGASATGARMRWGRVAAVAAAVFVLAMGALTAFELISGKSAADAVGKKSAGSTTVCEVVHCAKKSASTGTTTPAPSASATPSADTSASDAPSESASPSASATTSPEPAATDTQTQTTTTDPTATDTQTQQSDSGTGSDQNNDVEPQQSAQP
jgi:hypothetical protein